MAQIMGVEVSDETFQKLNAWACWEGPTDHLAHECDLERWREFVIAVARHGDQALRPRDVRDWLMQEKHFTERLANEAMHRFSRERSIILDYRDFLR